MDVDFFFIRVGIEVPKIEVRFQNLCIEGDAYVGTRALPTLLNSTLNTLEVYMYKLHALCSCTNKHLISTDQKKNKHLISL